MNKSDYIREVDALHAPDSLKNNFSELKPTPTAKLKKGKKITSIITACLAVAVLIGGAYGVGSSLSANKSSSNEIEIGDNGAYSYNNSNGTNENGKADSINNMAAVTQKLIKKASVSIDTKNSDELIKKINSQVKSLNGYTSSLSQNKQSEYIAVSTNVSIPADNLDSFLDFLEKSGTVTSKNVETTDVTDGYTDTESQITALETEEKALLAMLAKCETVQDSISVQDRLTSVRGDLESLRAQKKNYDRRIAYSEVSISISEVDRVKKAPTSFGSQVSEKFSESLYNIGQFFKNLGVFILGASPYLVIAAVVIIVIVLIVKRKRK